MRINVKNNTCGYNEWCNECTLDADYDGSNVNVKTRTQLKLDSLLADSNKLPGIAISDANNPDPNTPKEDSKDDDDDVAPEKPIQAQADLHLFSAPSTSASCGPVRPQNNTRHTKQ